MYQVITNISLACLALLLRVPSLEEDSTDQRAAEWAHLLCLWAEYVTPHLPPGQRLTRVPRDEDQVRLIISMRYLRHLANLSLAELREEYLRLKRREARIEEAEAAFWQAEDEEESQEWGDEDTPDEPRAEPVPALTPDVELIWDAQNQIWVEAVW